MPPIEDSRHTRLWARSTEDLDALQGFNFILILLLHVEKLSV